MLGWSLIRRQPKFPFQANPRRLLAFECVLNLRKDQEINGSASPHSKQLDTLHSFV